jgi:hypothetical protein
MTILPVDQITNSLRIFKARRDDLLHEDIDTFDPNLKRFVEFCQRDPLTQSVIKPLQDLFVVDANSWWLKFKSDDRDRKDLCLPDNPDEELLLRYSILIKALDMPQLAMFFGLAFGKRKTDEGRELFRNLIIRPFADEMSHRLGEAVDMATPEERALQAVPLNHIPRSDEVRIFLSHKSQDKPMVKRYYQALLSLGFSPWLDEPDMPAGTNLERALLKGFEESCAAVFFITDNFKDENYLATEVEYAILQKRKKGKKFSIITLKYAGEVPELLTLYIWASVSNDLDGFYQLIRALPIQAGPIRWKKSVVEETNNHKEG